LSLLQSCQNNIPARTMKARNVFLEPAGQWWRSSVCIANIGSLGAQVFLSIILYWVRHELLKVCYESSVSAMSQVCKAPVARQAVPQRQSTVWLKQMSEDECLRVLRQLRNRLLMTKTFHVYKPRFLFFAHPSTNRRRFKNCHSSMQWPSRLVNAALELLAQCYYTR
jgi:hypothetical protein